MSTAPMDSEQVKVCRDIINRAITVLRPSLRPGDAMTFTQHELRLMAGVLGNVLKARDVKNYVELELVKWKDDASRGKFLQELLAVVDREIELMEFYVESSVPRSRPLPRTIKVVDGITGNIDKEIPIEEFLQQLRSISASSIFKK